MFKENNKDLISNIEALKHGDRVAFSYIYNSFGLKLYAFARKLVPNQEDAEEVVQEVFLKLWERKHLLDPHQNFDGYLFRIARNLVYNKARHKVHELAYGKYVAGRKDLVGNPSDSNLDYEELNELIINAYSSLPPVRQKVFVMSRIEGLSTCEIAERLKTSNSNIENHINKALRDIRKKLKHVNVTYLILLYFFL